MEPDGTDFDAGQISLRDRGMPSGSWHPTSLLRTLAYACGAGPFVTPALPYESGWQQSIAVSSATARLSEAGFPVEELVREVFGPIIQGEFIRFFARAAFDLHKANPELPSYYEWVGATVLDDVAPSEEESFAQYFARVIELPQTVHLRRRAAAWVRTAELAELICWEVPEEKAWQSFEEELVDFREPPAQAKWLADRFLVTYLKDWSTVSLHEEYRWCTGHVECPVRRDSLDLRRVPREKLDAEIAKRAVESEDQPTSYQGDLVQRAVQLLQAERAEAAVALFQGALALSDDPWIQNGLAFCLLTVDPDEATALWERLLLDGFDPPLTRANLAAASLLAGRPHEAGEHARAGLAELESDRPAFLWSVGEDRPELVEVSLVEYLTEMEKPTRR